MSLTLQGVAQASLGFFNTASSQSQADAQSVAQPIPNSVAQAASYYEIPLPQESLKGAIAAYTSTGAKPYPVDPSARVIHTSA